MKIIKDMLGIPCKIGDTVLGLSGWERDVTKIQNIFEERILGENNKLYLSRNFLNLESIIKEYPQHMI